VKKTIWILACLVPLTWSGTLPAQANHAAEQRSVSKALDFFVTDSEEHLVPVAEAMPEEKYSFAPVNGEFKDVRTFAEQIKHLAANNYDMAAAILGENPTPEMENETGPDSVRNKAEVVAYLKGSFTALHKAVATIDDKNLLEPVSAGRIRQWTRLRLTIDAIAHSSNHYGQLVEYLRMNGIVPPASRAR
jgi:hypothetical protein